MMRPCRARTSSLPGLVLIVLLAAGCGGNGQYESRSAAPPALPGLEERVGWYEMPSGDTALVTFSATGGLRLFALGDSLFWVTLARADGGELRWGGAEGPRIEWLRAGGAIRGFAWSSGEGPRREARRLADHGYGVEELAVTVGDVRLSGSLFIPAGRDAPVPAAIMIHGSGASDRDNAWYMMIADALVRGGVAVLLPDKRGSGRSEGDWFSTDLSGFAGDAAAWLERVRTHPAVDADGVGLLGLSQGGRVAPMAAAPGVAFVINVSGAAVPLDDQLIHEVTQDLKRDRIPGIFDPLVRRVSIRGIRGRRPEWWAVNGPIDPLDHWRAVTVPALVVYGEDDELDNVPVRRSVERLRSLNRDNLDVWVFEGSGHALWEPEANARIQADGRRRIRAEFLDALARWIRELPERQ